jgi:hypothetical protein
MSIATFTIRIWPCTQQELIAAQLAKLSEPWNFGIWIYLGPRVHFTAELARCPVCGAIMTEQKISTPIPAFGLPVYRFDCPLCGFEDLIS